MIDLQCNFVEKSAIRKKYQNDEMWSKLQKTATIRSDVAKNHRFSFFRKYPPVLGTNVADSTDSLFSRVDARSDRYGPLSDVTWCGMTARR